MNRQGTSRIGWKSLLSIGLLALGLLAFRPWAGSAVTATDRVESVWTNVQRSDSYAFSADVVITSIPLPTIGNIGRFSRTDSLYLEGHNDVRGKGLELALWGGGVSVANRDAAYQVRVRDGRTETRAGDGEWQAGDSSALSFAPEGDFLAFLDMAKNVTLADNATCIDQKTAHAVTLSGSTGQSALRSDTSEESRLPTARDASLDSRRDASPGADPLSTTTDCDQFTVYTFDLDSRVYAARLSELAQNQMIRAGQLAPGASVQIPEHLAKITGTGELWVDARGLPVRQKVSMAVPAAAGADYRTETTMEIRYSDYQGYRGELAAIPVLGTLAGRLARVDWPAAPEAGATAGLFGATLLGAVVVARPGRRTRFTVTIAALVAMLITPTLQASAATLAAERLGSAQAEQAAVQKEQTAQESLQAARAAQRAAPPYVPPTEALGAGATAAAAASTPLGTGSTPLASSLDSDGDGLTDETEAPARHQPV